MSLAFLLCVERDLALEQQSVLLARSIRRWAGRHADAPIHAYRPRPGPPLREETVAALREAGAELHEQPLNRDLATDPMVNRVFVGREAERRLDVDVLVFCDSDAVFLGEPRELQLGEGVDAAVRPVGRIGKGSTGPGHTRDTYWLRMYEIAGVTPRPFVETAVTGERIRGYWNAGLVAVRRRAGVFERWLGVLERLLAAEHLQPEWRNPAIDQLSLAATLSHRPEAIRELDARYNYPLQRRALLKPPVRDLDLGSIVHIHYHRWFNRPGLLADVRPSLDRGGERYRWLNERLPLEPTIDDELPSRERPKGRARRRAPRTDPGQAGMTR